MAQPSLGWESCSCSTTRFSRARRRCGSKRCLGIRTGSSGRISLSKRDCVLSTRHDALVVPAVAVQRGPKGTFVYVVGDEGQQSATCGCGALSGDQAVLARVKPGEQIVIEGQNQLRPGAKVSARPAAGGSADRSDGGT